MNYPLSGYKIDNYDLYGIWKITVKKITGIDSFLNRKGDISQSWPDSDGEEAFTDVTDIYFEGRDVIMFCFIRGATFISVQQQIALFRHRLEMSGKRTLTVPYTTQTYSLMYVKGSDIEFITPKRKSSEYVGEFWVQFRETTPARN